MQHRPPFPDPENYVWITTKEGSFWRRKRGLNKPAKLNAAYAQSRSHLQLCSPVASQLVQLLKPYTASLNTGRLHARLCGKLVKAMNNPVTPPEGSEKPWMENGAATWHFGYLHHFDLQPAHPLRNLLRVDYSVKHTRQSLVVAVPIDASVQQHNKLVTDYFFELILIFEGTPPPKTDTAATPLPPFRIDSVSSAVHPIDSRQTKPCTLELPLPEGRWMALLKVSCLEGNEMAVAARNYGMKVVGVG